MTFTLEFMGLPRSLVGQKTVSLNFPPSATYRDLVRHLAESYPALVNLVIAPDGENFLSSNMFVINGDLANAAMILDEVIPEDAHLILMSVITGG